MTLKPLQTIEGPEDFSRAFRVSRETLARLEVYADLIVRWQPAVNLVAPSTLDALWHRHIGDSAQIVDILEESDSPKGEQIWLDIGSGGGFPGLVAAILLAEDSRYAFHLVESNGRKCAFLADVIRKTGIGAKVHHRRIEELGRDGNWPHVSVISARALASLDKLLELAEPLMREETTACFLKGREAQAELADAEKRWQFYSQIVPSRTSSDGVVLKISGLKRL